MIKKYFAMSIIAASVALAACSDDDDDDGDTDPVVTTDPGELEPGEVDPVAVSPAADITDDSSAYDILASTGNHTQLLAAINEAGLADTLDDPALDFTIFGPDDDAFDALGADAPTGDELTRVLQFHVVEGTVTLMEISTGITDTGGEPFELTTILADTGADAVLTFTSTDGGFTISDSFDNTATFGAQFDVEPQGENASGIFHSITTVLTPPEAAEVETPVAPVEGGEGTPITGDVGAGTQALIDAGTSSIYIDAVGATGTSEGFFPGQIDTSAFTFFAPTDAALGAAGVTELTFPQTQAHIVSAEALTPEALAAADGGTILASDGSSSYAVTVDADGVISVDGNVVTFVTAGDQGAQVYSVDGVLGADATAAQ